MAKALQSAVPAPKDPERTNENTSAPSNANDGSSGSNDDEELQRAQILAQARSVSTPPATPSITTDEIEVDITSKDVSEHAPGLYVARAWIRPRSLTPEEIEQIILRLQVDLALALSKIRAKSYKKPRYEDRVMIDMRMAGTPARGSTKVTLRPCIWIFCGSKWCQKIVERDVRKLNWLGPHIIHFVRKGGPVFAADERSSAGGLEAIPGHSSPSGYLSDDQGQYDPGMLVPRSGQPDYYDPAYVSTYGSTGPFNPFPTTYATGSTGGYEYLNDLSVAPAYAGISAYDVASVTSSSELSHSGGASSTPSNLSRHTDVNNTIDRQAVPSQVYELPCELRNLTGCNVVFPGDDEHGWMDHVESHLGGTFPSKLRCWFCNDHYFNAAQAPGGDFRYNFTSRMAHIRHHIVYEGYRPAQMIIDGHVVQHLFDHRIIDRRIYDSILSPTPVPPLPHNEGTKSRQDHQGHHRSHRIHRSHHSRLARVVENVPSESSGSSSRLSDSSDRHRRGHRRRDHERSHGSSHRQNHGVGDRSYDGNPWTETTRGQDYAHSIAIASLRLNDRASVAQSTGTDRPFHQPASMEGRTVKVAQSSNNNVVRNTGSVTGSATPADGAGSGGGRLDSAERDLQLRNTPKQLGYLQSGSAESHDSLVALRGSTEHRVHVRFQGLASLIGLSCISTTWQGERELSRSTSKVGGVISITVGGQTALYGVTAGHGLFHQSLNINPPSEDDPFTNELSDDSDSLSEDDEESPARAAESAYSGDGASSDSGIDLTDHATWTPIDCGITGEFLGIGLGPDSERESSPEKSLFKDTLSSDIALFPISSDQCAGLKNSYIHADSLETKEVTSIARSDFKNTLSVVILLGPDQTVSGSLEPGKFHFSMQGTPIDARKVRLSRDLAPGSSGSWVIHNQTLCGMIVAVFPGECMALMIPSTRMITDVYKLYPGATNLSAAIRYQALSGSRSHRNDSASSGRSRYKRGSNGPYKGLVRRLTS